MPAQAVFVSSTFLEFKHEREELHRVLTKVLRIACDQAEVLTCTTPDLEVELKRRIHRADFIVLLLGFRYGSTKGKISWTEREIRHARQLGKPVFPYLKDQERPPESSIGDLDRKKQARLDRFIRYIEGEVAASIPRFGDLLELVALVTRDINDAIHSSEELNYYNTFI